MASNVTFKGIELGDYCDHIALNYNRSVRTVELPRVDGVRLYNHGGGLETISVKGWVKKSTVKEAQEYLDGLAVTLTNDSGSLIANGVTYTNCFMASYDFDDLDCNFRTFNFSFVRSAY